jgi:succinate dehydrogenase flavin-adding protein (antitoxin of CptAB toxin-antitoxin module)
MDEEGVNVFDSILDYDDQKLFDYIFKGVSLSNDSHEIFIDKHLKKFTKQGNF